MAVDVLPALHTAQGVAAFISTSAFPAAHVLHLLVPAGVYCPALQAVQALEPPVAYFPAPHAEQREDPCDNKTKRSLLGPPSSCQAPGAALNSSSRRDRVTAHQPMALRAGASRDQDAVWV